MIPSRVSRAIPEHCVVFIKGALSNKCHGCHHLLVTITGWDWYEATYRRNRHWIKARPRFPSWKAMIIASGLQSKILIWNSQRGPTSCFYVIRDQNGNSKIGSKLNAFFLYSLSQKYRLHISWVEARLNSYDAKQNWDNKLRDDLNLKPLKNSLL